MPLALALAAPAPAPAQQVDPAAFDDLLTSVEDEVAAGRGHGALATINKDIKQERDDRMLSILWATRGLLLMDLKRSGTANKSFDEALLRAPDFPAAALVMFKGGEKAGNVDVALKGLNRLIAAFPEIVAKLYFDDLGTLISEVRKQKGDAAVGDLKRRLADVGFAADRPSDRDAMAISGIKEHLKRNEIDEARILAAHIEDREMLVILLTDRKFTILWPETEARVGPHMEAPVNAAVMAAERIFAAHPDSLSARSELMTAYEAAGRHEDAERIGADFAKDEASLRDLDEKGGWLVNYHASILRRMGKVKEADARYGSLMVSGIEEKPWLISMMINRAHSAWVAGDRAETARLIAEIDPLLPRYASPYAVQLIRRIKACEAYSAGRTDEGDALLDEIRANPPRPSESVYAEALICGHHDDEAAEVLIGLAKTEQGIAEAIDYLQPAESSPTNWPYEWSANPTRIVQRPDVQAAFLKVGRPLPKALWPQ